MYATQAGLNRDEGVAPTALLPNFNENKLFPKPRNLGNTQTGFGSYGSVIQYT